MNYQLEISDIGADGDGPSVYLIAFIEDMSNLAAFSNIVLAGNLITMESDLSEREIKDKLKPFFSRDRDYIHFVRLGHA